MTRFVTAILVATALAAAAAQPAGAPQATDPVAGPAGQIANITSQGVTPKFQGSCLYSYFWACIHNYGYVVKGFQYAVTIAPSPADCDWRALIGIYPPGDKSNLKKVSEKGSAEKTRGWSGS